MEKSWKEICIEKDIIAESVQTETRHVTTITMILLTNLL